MHILVFAEHEADQVRAGSRSAFAFATAVAGAGGDVSWLILGHELNAVATDAARYGPVLVADCPALATPLADRYAKVVADVVRQEQADMLVAASTTLAKDIVTRAAGLLGGAMASEVIGHVPESDPLQLKRPIYAGAVTATVTLVGSPQIVTMRASAYEPAGPGETPSPVTAVPVDPTQLPNQIEFEGLESTASGRPDVTEARVVVSGGRALKNRDDFERIVGGLADQLGAATGSTRALVDAGITQNELQVGQTGKVAAPELYFALGISGAVQHLAGMKNSKVIVAINSDPEAPIFEVADYGLVADIYEAVPELIEKLAAGAGAGG
jgi:electron transfer flavoprotein alpha subunit